MTYLTTEQVKELATKLHEGQLREDGQPYITHPIAVAELTKESKFIGLYHKSERDQIYQMALLHDVIEDCGVTVSYLIKKGVDPYVAGTVERDLTRIKDQGYADYIWGIDSTTAKIVKIADLTHNLIGAKGSRKDKYELAKKFLEQELSDLL